MIQGLKIKSCRNRGHEAFITLHLGALDGKGSKCYNTLQFQLQSAKVKLPLFEVSEICVSFLFCLFDLFPGSMLDSKGKNIKVASML